VLDEFLQILPPGARCALEFRHPSWLEEPVFDRLRRRNLAVCVADDGKRDAPRVATADYGYLRLRDEGYDPAALASWVEWTRAQPWREAFVYFKHEDEARGPELAQAVLGLIDRA
jgi:uncharacterized protein YecE (DUF72 family)